MNQLPIIIAIVGASGSGKTTLSKFLNQHLDIPYIVSYTTRPIRPGETDGIDHFFVDSSQVINQNTAFAYTEFGGYQYWTCVDQFNQAAIMTYVVDEKGLIEMKNRWTDRFKIIPVLIKRPNNPTEISRINRDKDRISLPESDYAAVILNDKTEREFFVEAITKLGALINLTNSQQ